MNAVIFGWLTAPLGLVIGLLGWPGWLHLLTPLPVMYLLSDMVQPGRLEGGGGIVLIVVAFAVLACASLLGGFFGTWIRNRRARRSGYD